MGLWRMESSSSNDIRNGRELVEHCGYARSKNAKHERLYIRDFHGHYGHFIPLAQIPIQYGQTLQTSRLLLLHSHPQCVAADKSVRERLARHNNVDRARCCRSKSV